MKRLLKKAALCKAAPQQKLLILENELCDCAQVIVDIYSRFLFESRLIEKRQEEPLSVEEIKDLMLEASKGSLWTWIGS